VRRTPAIVLGLIVLGGAGLPVARGGAARTSAPASLERTLRDLEKRIATVRGLRFKTPVVARVVPRPADAPRGIQGYYSIPGKRIVLYDDVKGSYERGVLVHEMVHALQDQHFGLAKLHQPSFGSDAELARAALVEGDATYTMIEVLKKEQPRAAAMLDVPLGKARNLQNAFLYAQGARYVQALKERGGWPAVNLKYRFPPGSTAAVLHPQGLPSIRLGPGKTVGEFGIIELLRSNPATAAEAVEVAAGWRADREVREKTGRSWEVIFSSPKKARRFHEALATLRAAQHPDWESMGTGRTSRVWHTRIGGVHAVLLRGERVLELEAEDARAYQALRKRVQGPPAVRVYARKEKRFISFGEMIDRLLATDLVCIGETHDLEPVHQVQLRVIEALFARDKRLGVGMEMFQRPFQKVLDLYVRGQITDKQLLKESEYTQRWGFAWALYRPIAAFCRQHGIPLAALNVPRELTARLSQVGYDKLTAAEKKRLGRVDFHSKAHRAYWFDRLARMHGNTKATAEEKERSYQVMTSWDEYMGASAARFLKGRGLRRLVVLAGSGHIDRGFGIPARAARRTGGTAATLHIEVGGDAKEAIADGVADFIVIVK
jgi:uncharacterized iron-regulated protein